MAGPAAASPRPEWLRVSGPRPGHSAGFFLYCPRLGEIASLFPKSLSCFSFFGVESPIAHTADVKGVTSCVRRAIPGLDVPIRAILENDHAFGPEDIANLTAAFEAALIRLGPVDRGDPLTTVVAKAIIQLAKNGERDPKKLCDGALQILGK